MDFIRKFPLVMGALLVLWVTRSGADPVEPPLAFLDYGARDPRISVETGVMPFAVPGEVDRLRWSPDGKWILAGVKHANLVSLIDARQGKADRLLRLMNNSWTAGRELVIGMEVSTDPARTQRRFGCWNLPDLNTRWIIPNVENVLSSCISPDGSQVALVASSQRAPTRLLLVDAINGKVLWETASRKLGACTGVRFVHEGFIGVTSGKLLLFDRATGKEASNLNLIFEKTPGQFRLVDANPTAGTLLLLWEGALQVWKIRSAQAADLLKDLKVADDGSEGMFKDGYLSPDGRSICALLRDGTRVYPLEPGEIRTYRGGGEAITPSSDGKLAARSCCSLIRVQSTANGKQFNVLPAHQHTVSKIRFSPDGSLLAAAAGDTLCFWNSKSGKFEGQIPNPNPYSGSWDFCFHPDGSSLYLGDGGSLWKWDYRAALAKPGSTARERLARWEWDTAFTFHLGASSDGRHLCAGVTYNVYFFDFQGRRDPNAAVSNPFIPQKRAFQPKIKGVALSPDGTRSAVHRDEWLDVVDVQTRTLAYDVRVGQLPLAYSADGTKFAHATPGFKGEIVLRNWENGETLASFPLVGSKYGSDRQPTALALSTEYLAAAAYGLNEGWSGIYLWDLESGKLRAIVPTTRGRVTQMEFHGSRLAALNADGSATLWDVSLMLSPAK